MERQTIAAGWLTLRPFTTADVGWAYEVSRDPALQHFVRVHSPYLPENAVFFVEQVAIAGWDSGQRAEFVAQDAAGTRLGRVGLALEVAVYDRLHAGPWIDGTVQPAPNQRIDIHATVRELERAPSLHRMPLIVVTVGILPAGPRDRRPHPVSGPAHYHRRYPGRAGGRGQRARARP